MKRVLIIAHQFPPAGGIGVQRIKRFCMELPHHGWRPLVLTGSGDEYPFHDFELLHDFHPAVKIIRADLPRVFRKRFSSLVSVNQSEGQHLFQQIGFHIWIYDDFYPWLLPAYKLGRRILKEFKPDAIFATGSPFCSLIAADLIRGTRNVPLFVDFRDGWHECPYRRKRGAWPNWLEGFFEQRILRHSQHAFFVTRGLLKEYRNKYPNFLNKFVWLPNGFQKGNGDLCNKFSSPGHVLTVKYVGKITPYRRPDAFLRGLSKAVRDLGCTNIIVEFVGGLDRNAWAFIKKLDLGKHIKCIPFVPHKEAQRHICDADVLLLLVDRAPGYRVIQTGKIFEYMLSRRPVLCVSPPDSEAARTVRESGLGTVFMPEDEEGIAQALVQWAQEKIHSGFVRANSAALPEQYNQTRITERLASYLNG